MQLWKLLHYTKNMKIWKIGPFNFYRNKTYFWGMRLVKLLWHWMWFMFSCDCAFNLSYLNLNLVLILNLIFRTTRYPIANVINYRYFDCRQKCFKTELLYKDLPGQWFVGILFQMLLKLFIRRMLLSQNTLNTVIREIRACVTCACIHGNKVEICINYGHCLHHDARITHDFSNFEDK